MSLIIVIEKPFLASKIVGIATQEWPDETVSVLCCNPYKDIRFAFPHGMRWADLPLISSPEYQVNIPDRDVSRLHPSLRNIRADQLSASDRILLCATIDHTGAIWADLLTKHLQSQTPANIQTFCLSDSASDTIRTSLRQTGDAQTLLAAQLDYGKTKRYFDWNWLINSIAIFGKTQQAAGMLIRLSSLSKNHLQLLYFLRGQPPMSEGQLINKMANWIGTGKYQNPDVSMGSPASTANIIDQLLTCMLIAHKRLEPGAHHVELSDLGRKFLDAIHPDCCDPDLPFRLHNWCQAGLVASKPSIDRYIRTVFGKQMRYLNKPG